MNLYELGVLTTVTTTTTPVWELMASGQPLSVLELGVFLNAATASTFQLARPGNTPVGGTPQTATLPINRTTGGTVSGGGMILSGWGTAPTVAAAGNVHKKISMPNAVGAGVVWTWNPGEMIVEPTRSSSLIIWTLSVVSAFNVYAKFLE